MSLKLAIVVSHPIPHFAPLHREAAQIEGLHLRVFFCCDWGIAAYTDPGFGAALQWDVPLQEGYAHEFLAIRRRPKRLRPWEVDNPEVGEALDRFSPDVVKVHGYAHRTNWRVAAWARRRGVPLLLFSDSTAAAAVPVWKRLLKTFVVGRFYDRVDGALYVGDGNLAYHLRYGLPRERLFPGALPVDTKRLLASCPDPVAARTEVRARHGIPESAFVVMLCGKLVDHKRPVDLIRAAADGRSLSRPLWVLLVGEGPLRPSIEGVIRRRRLANVVLSGFVNQSQIAAYYAAVDVLALTSSREARGLVVSEGAVFGLPVIASDRVGCVGANDTARPGVNALVYEYGNVAALREAIETLVNDPALRARMGHASREIAATQDATAAAHSLDFAARELCRMGPRRPRSGKSLR